MIKPKIIVSRKLEISKWHNTEYIGEISDRMAQFKGFSICKGTTQNERYYNVE